jgi:chaperone required for assembly of F1-ATPase
VNEAPARRFYKAVATTPVGAGFAVTLDGRTLRSPATTVFAAPTEALAAACAAEWDAQRDVIRHETMPLTRLVNVAIDHTPRVREELANTLAKFAETDLLSHRAERGALALRQAGSWDPLLAWADQTLGAPLKVVAGIIAQVQPATSLAALAERAGREDDFHLTGLAHAAGLAGSAVIAFALRAGRLSGQAAFEASALDDLYQLQTWGEDEEARQRLNNQRAEFLALEQFFAALGSAW